MVVPSYAPTSNLREDHLPMFGFVIEKVIRHMEKEKLGKTRGIVRAGGKWSRLNF